MSHYTNIQEVIDTLNNQHTPYLVLRNYDNLLSNEIYMDGHGDIDILCTESKPIVEALHAKTKHKDQKGLIGDGTHYHIYVSNQPVSIDLRYIGDGYYCDKWQEEMLKHRVLHKGFYVMDAINHFYSLVYHAILQKNALSEEYQSRLLSMAAALKISLPSQDEKGLLKVLEDFMKRNGYTYTYCIDHYIPLQFQKVNKKMIVLDEERYWKHWKFKVKISFIDLLVKIKHLILK